MTESTNNPASTQAAPATTRAKQPTRRKRATHPSRQQPPTRMFMRYVLNLAFRLVLFVAVLVMFIRSPEALDVNARFGPAEGFNLVDFIFIALVIDFVSKLFQRAKISMGSLKQYRRYHIPTANTYTGGRPALFAHLRELYAEHDNNVRAAAVAQLESARAAAGQAVESTRTALGETFTALNETRETFAAQTRRLLNNVDFLNVLNFDEADLRVPESQQITLRMDRAREIMPAMLFWIGLNAVLALVLGLTGNLTPQVVVLWSMFYFLSDMICVVFWCPIQLLLMHNRCCTTCQIFNWDAIMVATPLFFVGGWFGWPLVALALVVLFRWELAALRHPERFDERTNARLRCVNCIDKLCYLRPPLEPRVPLAPLVQPIPDGPREPLVEQLRDQVATRISPERDESDSHPKPPRE